MRQTADKWVFNDPAREQDLHNYLRREFSILSSFLQRKLSGNTANSNDKPAIADLASTIAELSVRLQALEAVINTPAPAPKSKVIYIKSPVEQPITVAEDQLGLAVNQLVVISTLTLDGVLIIL